MSDVQESLTYKKNDVFYNLITRVYIEDIEDSNPEKCKPLVKTHKQKPFPIRLLLSGCVTPIQPLSKFVQPNIGHLTEYLPFQILDTKEFLQKISEVNNTFAPLPDSACFAACDVVALYPNVNNMELPAVTSPLKEHPSRLGIRTDCVIEALDIALTNNTCVYTDETTSIYVRPNRGTAMGPNHACNYVDVFMSELDRKLMSTCPVPLPSSLLPCHLQKQYRYLDWSRFQTANTSNHSQTIHRPFTDHSQTASSHSTRLTSSGLFLMGKRQPTWMSLFP